MRKVGGVVEDKKLRQEFEEYGEVVTEKITDKNRPILIKKLNHLKARRRMSEKLSQSMLKESPKKPTASKRGRGKKGKSVKTEPSLEAALDDKLDTGTGDQLNGTFSVSDTSADVEPPAKHSRNTTTISIPYASDGPYAVARKRAAKKSQHSNEPHEPSETGSTNVAQNDELMSKPLSPVDFSQYFPLPPKSGVQKGGRTRTVGDFRGSANTVSVSTEVESVDGNDVQKTSLPMKRNARASVMPAAAAVSASSSIPEETVAESISSSVPFANVKVTVPSAEERGYGTSRGQKHKPGELSKSVEDVEKQSAASRIPKLARFPTPPSQQKSVASTAVSASVATAVVDNTPKVTVTARVMDTVSGRPAAGVAVKLFSEKQSGTWSHMADCTTADNGTAAEFGKEKRWTVGTYRLHFETGLYFHQHGMKTLFPHIDVAFVVVDPAVPVDILLSISPYGYSTHAHIDASY